VFVCACRYALMLVVARFMACLNTTDGCGDGTTTHTLTTSAQSPEGLTVTLLPKSSHHRHDTRKRLPCLYVCVCLSDCLV
jgi:hypothetical protein